MSQAIGIVELTSIAKGMEVGDVMLKSANVTLLACKTLCPGKYLLMIGGDVSAVGKAVAIRVRKVSVHRKVVICEAVAVVIDTVAGFGSAWMDVRVGVVAV